MNVHTRARKSMLRELNCCFMIPQLVTHYVRLEVQVVAQERIVGNVQNADMIDIKISARKVRHLSLQETQR